MRGKISQVKWGILLSYILIALNAIYNLAITPFIINCIGTGEYGVYKTMSSMTASLMVIDLGIGGTVQRFVAKYKADRQEENIPNFLAMSFIQTGLLAILLTIAFIFVYFFIEPIYAATFSVRELIIAKRIFIIMAVTMVAQAFGDVVNGIIIGYNEFLFGNGIKILRLLIKIISVFCLLIKFKSALILAYIDLFITFVFIIAQIIYVGKKLRVHVKYEFWNKKLFYESGKYTMLMFITVVISQFYFNVDNMIIGATWGTAYVTVYSIGLSFFGVFQNISGAVSGVMLPTITNVLAEKDGYKKVVELIIKAGRLQFMSLGPVLVGFSCIGKDFIRVWLGEGFEDVYIITLLLIAPSIFEFCINVCLSILRAKNRLGFRTVMTCLATSANILLTIILVKKWSYIGASVGTAFSYIMSSLIAMNIYYYKVIGLPMIKIYTGILKRIWACILLSGIAIFVSSRFIYGSFGAIIINIVVFVIFYSISLLRFGLSKEEINSIPILRNFHSTRDL